ncbi:MAG: hypothetical protein QE263_04355 [Vampirovibrionales bacterium]|nr:hypothetical protein [Vampirovibrionales bacterium]
MPQSIMSIIALAVVALWVLFSGGTPVVKFIVYRVLFVAFAAGAAMFTVQTFNASGLGPAVLVAGALVVAWSLFVGPMASGLLGFRKNPKELPHTQTTSTAKLASQL